MENSFSIKLEASMANFDVLPPIFTTFFIQVFIVASIRRDPTFFSRFRIGGRMIFPRWYFSIAFSKDIIMKFFWMAMKISYLIRYLIQICNFLILCGASLLIFIFIKIIVIFFFWKIRSYMIMKF